jgi:hypothetical protein
MKNDGGKAMRHPRLTRKDWDEIYFALDLKADEVAAGRYDEVPGEADMVGSETFRWAVHLRIIIGKIGPR